MTDGADPTRITQPGAVHNDRVPETERSGDGTTEGEAATSGRWLVKRDLVSPTSVYYTARHDEIRWSTNPLDLITRPALADVRHELLPLLIMGIPVPANMSCFTSLRRLPAGHALRRVRDGIQAVQVDDFRASEEVTLRTGPGRLLNVIEGAVAKSIPPGSRVGVLLSGGIDSATVAYLAQRYAAKVIAIHWSKPRYAAADESEAAAEVAAHLGIDLRHIDVTDDSAMATHLECQDTAVPAAHPYQRWYERLWEEAARCDVTVILSGRLGDALFGKSLRAASFPRNLRGLTCFDVPRLIFEWCGTTIPTRHLLSRRPTRTPTSDVIGVRLLRTAAREVVEAFSQPNVPTHVPRAAVDAYREVKEVLEREANIALLEGARAHQIAYRAPFGDRDVVQLGLAIPPALRLMPAGGRLYDKPLLRLALLGRLPERVLQRNAGPWLLGLCAAYCERNEATIRELLGRESLLAELDVIDTDAVTMATSCVQRLPELAIPLINAVMVERWLRVLAPTRGDAA